MSFLSEKSARRFFFGIAAFLLLLFIFDLSVGLIFKCEIKDALLERDLHIASSLSRSGVSELEIARALTSSDINEGGETILKKLAFTENSDSALFPVATELSTAAFLSAVKFVLLSAFLLIITVIFLKKREALYRFAAKKIDSQELPCNFEGGIYLLFEKINNMKASLDAMRKKEKAAKEFIKRMVSDISHQLKTPLAALSMYNEIIISEVKSVETTVKNGETVVKFSEKSANAIERMKNLILTLLKLTRLHSGGVNFEILPQSALGLISFSLENLSERAEREGKTIILPKGDSVVFCDIFWAGEALGNVIKNALDSTERGGEIKISIEKTPLDTRIAVSDNGGGISSEDFHHIFRRFYKSAASEASDGFGLGLPIARSVMESHGGEIYAESEIGKGSLFTLVFPDRTAYKNVR